MENLYKRGDIVVCMGGVKKDNSEFAPSFVICKVLEVGYDDLMVREHPARSFAKTEIVPKSNCIKIELPEERIVSSRPRTPQIGDLVYCFPANSYDTKEPFSGILYSIEYKFGKPSSCEILCGEEFKTTAYQNLLVLEIRDEQGYQKDI